MSGIKGFALSTLSFYPNKNPKLRLFALWYFAILIVVWMVAGLTILGFEQSYAQPIVGVSAAIGMQMLLEWVEARSKGRPVRFSGGWANFANFLPPAIIPGVAVAMLTYSNDRLWPVAFTAVLSIASKVLFRAPIGNGQTQHVFNPSNIGITLTFLLLPAVGPAPPYQFTQNVPGLMRWVIPGIILLAGIIVHAKFTGRLILVMGWLTGWVTQALVRIAMYNLPFIVPFVPMTSAGFTLFTLFMIPDPATTPLKPWRQFGFGFAVAALYGVLFVLHIVFGLFYALAIMSAIRGVSLWMTHLKEQASLSRAGALSATPASAAM
jgi:hypothetical protein